MNAGVVSGTLHPASVSRRFQSIYHRPLKDAVKVPTLRVTAARGHLLRHRSSTMQKHRRRRASLHLTPRRS
jgi:hypothetical protein